jgi:hypothetical protein
MNSSVEFGHLLSTSEVQISVWKEDWDGIRIMVTTGDLNSLLLVVAVLGGVLLTDSIVDICPKDMASIASIQRASG